MPRRLAFPLFARAAGACRIAAALTATAALVLVNVGEAAAKGKPKTNAKEALAKKKPRAKVTKAPARGKEKTDVKFDPDWAKHPSAQYAALSGSACTAELGRRGIEFVPVKEARGVLAPVRLPKDVGGVVYRTEVAGHLRAKNPFDVFDCRLVLALSDFSKILAAHAIDEVLMFSAWRPPTAKWPEGKLGTRHPGALAIDAYRFGKKQTEEQKERVWLDVTNDFMGTIGAPVCGPEATLPEKATAAAKELRAIVCEAADQYIFTSILTPNYNQPHYNHFHLEVTPDVKWHLVR